MRVLHTVGWYFPESSGGTEVYVRALARHLATLGVDSAIAAPASGDSPHDHEVDGVPVHRYVVGAPDRAELTFGRPHQSFDAFCRWLDTHRPDIYHQHSWTRGCGPAHLQYARDIGLRTVLTVHVPSVICLRGTMMLDGATACDGLVETARCTSCWSATRGIPSTVATWQAQFPGVSSTLASWLPPSRLRTLFATPALVDTRRQSLHALNQQADQVIAVCHWLHDALAANGVTSSRLHCVEQGTDAADADVAGRPAPSGRLRVGLIGRWDPVKGIDVLVEAVRRLEPDVAVDLTIHAMPGDTAYETRVRQAAARETRITFGPALSREQVPAALAGFDVLAVPSQWLETGPLVVLEAFAVGTPIVGSDLGGIRELVTHDVDGLLIPARDVDAWTSALRHLAAGRARELGAQVRPPRTSAAVARDMHAIYSNLAPR